MKKQILFRTYILVILLLLVLNVNAEFKSDEDINMLGNEVYNASFINATLYAPNSQNMKDAIEFMKRIGKARRPKYIQTDGLPFYPKSCKKVFYTRYNKDKVKHKINIVRKTKKHNVRIETVFSKIKDRVYDFRGFKAIWSAPILMAGIVLQHNFIEEHTTTGEHPCKLAGMDLDVGENRWDGLIRMSSK